MPLDIWVAKTHTFQEIHGPHTEGGLDPDLLSNALDERGVRADDEWRFWLDELPGWSAQPVVDIDATYLKVSVAMATPNLSGRLRGAVRFAADLAARLDANAFEAAAGRRLTAEPSERWLEARSREGEAIRKQMVANGLAPLEFPFQNLDTVNNFLTWIADTEPRQLKDALGESLIVRGQPESRSLIRWDVVHSDFATAWSAGVELSDRCAQLEIELQFDGRRWDSDLARAYAEAPSTLATDFYRWWIANRERWKHV